MFKLEGFITLTILLTAPYLRHAAWLLPALQFEQSVKGKKEINSTLTNVNKVLLVQQRWIDSIKQANVPLACLSFNYITRALLYILPWGQPIFHHICVHINSCVWVCVHDNTCVWLFRVCSRTASLYIYWNEQSSLGHLCEAQACSHASIYRLPWIKAWLKRPLPCGPREVTHTETKFRRREQGEFSRAQIRGPCRSQWRHESMKWYSMTLRDNMHKEVTPKRFVEAVIQLGKLCQIWQVTFVRILNKCLKPRDCIILTVWFILQWIFVVRTSHFPVSNNKDMNGSDNGPLPSLCSIILWLMRHGNYLKWTS